MGGIRIGRNISDYYTLDQTSAGTDPFAQKTLLFAKGNTNTAGGIYNSTISNISDGTRFVFDGNNKITLQKPGGSSFVISEFTFEGEFEFTNVQYGGSSQPVYNQYIMDSGVNSTVLRWQRWIYE